MFTDNPVMDAEMYNDSLERQEERREAMECGYCHGPIYKGDDYYDGDHYYEINDMVICDECISSYIRKIRKEYV